MGNRQSDIERLLRFVEPGSVVMKGGDVLIKQHEPKAGNIGKPVRRIELEPMPEEAPVSEPAPQQPVPEPEPEEVPA